MQRKIYDQLLMWSKSPNRKPLILQGARQTGKTWIIQAFGADAFENTVYVNCSKQSQAEALFADYDIKRILMLLEAISGQKIEPGRTLIIFDEIEACPKGLNALKYFCENARDYHVAAVISKMGLALPQGTAFPVGKVDFLTLHPMDFGEFLTAMGDQRLKDILASGDWTAVAEMKETFALRLRQYLFTGGMPEAVGKFIETQDLQAVRREQQSILSTITSDIIKHAPKSEVLRILQVLESLPAQLSKDNKKFFYKLLQTGVRSAQYEAVIAWLVDAGFATRVKRVNSLKMPLSLDVDPTAFKLYFLDVGLLAALAGIPAERLLVGDGGLTEMNGALIEQFVCSQLATCGLTPYYWNRGNGSGELEFVVQTEKAIIPIEVKPKENLRSRSLRVVIKEYKNLKGLRLSMSDRRDQTWMENRPLYSLSEQKLDDWPN